MTKLKSINMNEKISSQQLNILRRDSNIKGLKEGSNVRVGKISQSSMIGYQDEIKEETEEQ